MRRRLLLIAAVLFLAGVALAVVGWPSRTASQGAVVAAGEPVEWRFPDQPAGGRSYEGRIKDVRPAWDALVLTVGQGSEAHDMRFDIGEARIVGPDGAEWKGQDLRVGDRVRVQLAGDGNLVEQISELAD